MFARPITEQEWFATSAIAGTAPEPVMIASVPFPRRVKRQKSQGRVKALKAMIRDTVALRADWNLFGPEDDEIQRASVPQRRAVPRQEQRHLVDARRCGLQAWLGKKAAERRALRARIDAEHAALFDEDEALRGTLTSPYHPRLPCNCLPT